MQQHDDLSSFSFGLETPSKFLSGPTPTTPNQWSLGLTPSLFGRGHTPSGAGETNPFDLMNFDDRSHHHHKDLSFSDMLDSYQQHTHAGGIMSSGGGGSVTGRKRALSSPACTPGGTGGMIGSMAFLDQTFKRPKFASDDSSSNLTSRSGTSGTNLDELSPISSNVLTPTDSGVLPLPNMDGAFSKVTDDFSLDHQSQQVGIHPSAFETNSLDVTISLPPLTQPTYQQFAFAPSLSSTNATTTSMPFTSHNLHDHLRSYTASRPHATQLEPSKVSLNRAPASVANSATSSNTATVTAGKKGVKGTTAKGKKGKKAAVGKVEEEEDKDEPLGEGEDDDEARRKMFLERNRIAACKSRQKKKERVGNLEQQARDIGARNAALQSVAIALHDEVRELRAMLNDHDGCSCQHIHGYLAREAAGGGIPTIDALAGRTLALDYTNVPTMGSEDDLYASIAPSTYREVSEAPSNGTVSAQRRMSTTFNARSPPKMKFPVLPGNDIPVGKPGPSIPVKRQQQDDSMPLGRARRNSAPATSPFWAPHPTEAQPDGYFAIKVDA